MSDHRATIEQQADEVGREVRSRQRTYPDAVARGRLLPDTAERKIATLADAERTLRFIARHQRGLRALCHFLVAAGDSPAVSRPPAAGESTAAAGDSPAGGRPPAAGAATAPAAGSAQAESPAPTNNQSPAPTKEETAAIIAHPGVRALLDVWPDAEVTLIRPVFYHTTPEPDAPSGRLADREAEGAIEGANA